MNYLLGVPREKSFDYRWGRLYRFKFYSSLLKKQLPNDTVVNVDKLTYAGDLKNLEGVEKFKNYYFEQIDITDKMLKAL